MPEVAAAPAAAGSPPVALLLTDLVDSSALASTLGDEVMARVWAAHDRLARDLLRDWRGREIDKTDGFLLLFDVAADALGYALAYHRALDGLETAFRAELGPTLRLRARAGLHVGQVQLRETPSDDVARGAKPLEVDGVSKPLAARVMSTALGRQTLLTLPALQAVGATPHRVLSHGHWRVKGLPLPLELFEVGEAGAPFTPPPDGEKVYRVVRQGDLWLPARELRHGLPAERDIFVGRRDALGELARRFDGGSRLVSLVGIGGCGKTRLATRFGWVWMGDFPGGVWFCDLAQARGVEGILYAVAQGLDVPLGKDDPLQQLGHAIAGRGACLVILDNFEHLARLAEDTLGRWLERAPQARFLVTTREVLGIPGEETLALAPLQPRDAEKLFLRRAAAAKNGFVLTADDAAAVATLVRLLDGLPLAIELAAARVRTLSPRALLARMSERFKLLASSGGRLDRQSTLRATFDWSWDLMSAAEKAALAQLAVFEGGFTLEAAEAVVDLQHLADAPWTLDVVIALADKSFVRPLVGDRYDLLGSVQAYAAEHLQTEGRFAGSGPALRQAALLRHAAWFAALGPERAVQAGCADLDNLAAACRRALQADEPALATGALRGAWAALALHGPFAVGVDLAEAVCAMPALQGALAANAQAMLGMALDACGQRDRALVTYLDALDQAVVASDRHCQAEVLIRLAPLHGRKGRADVACDDLSAAMAIARQLGDDLLACAALNGLGTVDFEQGDADAAAAHYQAAMERAQRAGDTRWQAKLLGNMGLLHASRGRLREAASCFERALAIAVQVGDRQREGMWLSNLGMLHYLDGDSARAVASLQTALRLASELGFLRLECTSLANLGLALGAAGDWEGAHRHSEAAIALARRVGHRRVEAQMLGQLGLACAHRGLRDAACAALNEADGLFRTADDPEGLAILLCAMAESFLLLDDPRAAQLRDQAQAMAAADGVSASAEFGVALSRLENAWQARNAPQTTA